MRLLPGKKFLKSMTSAKIIKQIGKNGRIVIPQSLIKDIFKTTAGEYVSVEILYNDDSIILKRFQISCSFCDCTDDLKEYKGIKICRNCIEKIKNL